MPQTEHNRPLPGVAAMRRDAAAIFQAGLQAVRPEKAIAACCRKQDADLNLGKKHYDLNRYRNIFLFGASKATAAMALAMEKLLASRISKGLISVKHGHGLALRHTRIIEAGHPLPDAGSEQAAARILDIAHGATADDLIIVLLSGGGSALMALPWQGLTLADKQKTSDLLLASGATIHEMNALRKHISAIKGGRLVQAAYPATVAALILSDVVGDDLDVIASGPTVPDPSTFAQCLEIVDRYQLQQKLPERVWRHLQNGAAGQVPETPKTNQVHWPDTHNLIVASNRLAVQAAALEARKRGYAPLVLSTRIEGETRTVAQVHGAIAREVLFTGQPLNPPACLLSGGETTVTLRGKGKGGRNQEFALASAMDIDGAGDIVVLSGGTDGSDGPTDAAGAIADHTTAKRAAGLGLDIRTFLHNNDAYTFFSRLDDLLITGPTLTNVMDLRILLISKPAGRH